MKLDLLNSKMWTPNQTPQTMIRWYFDEKYIQVVKSKCNAYYKLVGFDSELQNDDEVRSQISYFTGIETDRIYTSKF